MRMPVKGRTGRKVSEACINEQLTFGAPACYGPSQSWRQHASGIVPLSGGIWEVQSPAPALQWLRVPARHLGTHLGLDITLRQSYGKDTNSLSQVGKSATNGIMSPLTLQLRSPAPTSGPFPIGLFLPFPALSPTFGPSWTTPYS